MKNRKQKTIDMEKGFTLIELLLVIAIVTLLSSAFFYSSTQARNKAEDAHMKMEAKQVETAISMYKEDNNGQVPHYGNLEPGKLYREGDNNDDYENNMDLLVEDGYLSEIPTSPDGNSYAYGFTSDWQNGLFMVDLNNPQPEGSSNSCSFVEPSLEFFDCIPIADILGPWSTFPQTCSNQSINPINQMCFDQGSYESACNCPSLKSNNSAIPDNICNNYCYQEANMPGANETTKGYICDFEYVETVCGSSNPNDYCLCID